MMIIIFSNDIFGQQISWLQFWPGLSIIFHWKSSSLSAVERYFSVVRPFNQLRNRFFFRFKFWPKYFFCRGFCDPPWRSPSPAFSSPSSSHFPTISCSPQCASKHNLHKLAEFVIFYAFQHWILRLLVIYSIFHYRERLVLSDSPLNSTFLQVRPWSRNFMLGKFMWKRLAGSCICLWIAQRKCSNNFFDVVAVWKSLWL